METFFRTEQNVKPFVFGTAVSACVGSGVRGTCLEQRGTLLLRLLQTLGEGVDHLGPLQLLRLPLLLQLPHLLPQPLADLRLQRTPPPLDRKSVV